jgi:predicted Rossmann-fold nucleotide-binding protein
MSEKTMRVIIAGSRSITDQSIVDKAVEESGFKIDVVISGGARGVDSLGEDWASRNGKQVDRFLPDWGKHGKSAGFIRNDLMVKAADALIAVTNGSRGTAHTISMALRKGIPTYIVEIPKDAEK